MTNFFTFFAKSLVPGEIVKTSTTLSAFPFDVATLMETQRRNLQALATMQQLSIESLQVIAHRQAALLSDMAHGQGEVVREWNASDSPEDKIGDQALILKDLYERTLAHLQEINDMLLQSRTETAHVLHDRIGASLAEIKESIDRAKIRRAA